MAHEYLIADLAEEFDVTPRTLRFYETKGILNPTRQGVRRIFSDKDRHCLALALRAKRLGFGLDEITEMTALCAMEPPTDAQQLFSRLQRLRPYSEKLRRKFNDLNSLNDIISTSENSLFKLLASAALSTDAQLDADVR